MSVRRVNSRPGLDVTLTLLAGVEGTNGNLKSTEDHQLDTDITTFDEFRILGLSCQDISGADIFLKLDEPNENACSVLSDIQLVFSSRICATEMSAALYTLNRHRPQPNGEKFG